MSAVALTAPILAAAMVYCPVYAAYDITTPMVSPYGLGPLYQNPLKPIVEKLCYDAVCAGD